MTAIGATNSMNKPTRSRRMSRNSLPIVSHTASSIIASLRIAQRVAGEFEKRVLQIGAMDVEFDDLVASFARASNHVGHLLEAVQGGGGSESVEHLPRQFGDAVDSVGPSGRELFLCRNFDSRLRARQRDQFAVGALRNYIAVIDQHDSIAQPFRFFHVVRAVEDRAAGLRS